MTPVDPEPPPTPTVDWNLRLAIGLVFGLTVGAVPTIRYLSLGHWFELLLILLAVEILCTFAAGCLCSRLVVQARTGLNAAAWGLLGVPLAVVIFVLFGGALASPTLSSKISPFEESELLIGPPQMVLEDLWWALLPASALVGRGVNRAARALA